jgi:cyclopropane-fatty-acyl-phospholipid synthase
MTSVMAAEEQRVTRSSVPGFVKRLLARATNVPCTVEIRMLNGERIMIGSGTPALTVHVRTPKGQRALTSLSALGVCEAYIQEDIDFEGDLIPATQFQNALSDKQFGLKTWRRLKPKVVGRDKCNPEWIALHYDSNNMQLIGADQDYHTYTPGTYLTDDESLESGAARKLENAFNFLKLKPGMSLLEAGCGWGGMTRFSARRGVNVTAITLSRRQLEFTQQKIEEEGLTNAKVSYQDFFTYEPEQQFDAVSLMGVIEDLSDYQFVMSRLTKLVRVGGRVYLDFASARNKFGTSSFITKYIWPGTFRMVPLPEFIDAVTAAPFDIKEIHNDRHNYHLWAKGVLRRWMDNKPMIVEKFGEAVWRTQHIMQAGTAGVMGNPACGVNAYRVVLERRAS